MDIEGELYIMGCRPETMIQIIFQQKEIGMQKKPLILTGILLLALVLSACSGVAAAQGPTPTADNTGSTPRTLTVSGSGKAYLTPDIAYVNIGVHTEGKDAAEAVSSNNSQSTKVVDALKQFGIDPKDIQTTNFSIYPQQQYDNQGKSTGITYVVDNSVYVTVRKLDTIGNLLDTVVKAGANSINGVQFDVADKTQALTEARKAAVADAQTTAQELAQAAGVTLGPVQTLTVSAAPIPVPGPVFAAKTASTAEASVPVSAGQMTVTVDVNIVYQIQ
jgi:uncharacterized protein